MSLCIHIVWSIRTSSRICQIGQSENSFNYSVGGVGRDLWAELVTIAWRVLTTLLGEAAQDQQVRSTKKNGRSFQEQERK
jgi:hypothetical protein